MSDDLETPNELDLLKERAKTLGIPITGNMKAETLKARIAAKLGDEEGEADMAAAADAALEESLDQTSAAEGAAPTAPERVSIMDTEPKPAAPAPKAAPAIAPSPRLTKAQQEQQIREKIQREKMYLVRCRIYNLNPAKVDLPGEIITVQNKYLGTVRKFIPFGEATDNGYHIEKVLYDDLRARKFQQIQTKKIRGQIVHETRLVSEYSIELLPNLTPEELRELATQQAAADRLTPTDQL